MAEGEQLSFGHMANPAFGTEVARIHPLPHQRIAVYDHMLKQKRLRFLLADDAGAGKTIMTGLYIREMFARRLLKRVLIVSPAGLVGNWQRELAILFGLTFRIVSGSDARDANPFVGEDSDCVIVSLDTLAGARVFSRLQEPEVFPYDLVVFDEAHKLSAHRGADLYVSKTDRYKLAEALAGIKGLEPQWTLSWSVPHLLLLTATPHMGKDYPYYALWRLLEPEILSTSEAFSDFPPERRWQYFIRRTKEEYVEHAAPLIDLAIDGDPGNGFMLRPLTPRAADALWRCLETYPESQRGCLSFLPPQGPHDGIWLHPGEPLFEAFRRLVTDRLGSPAKQGAIFTDPTADKPYLFHLAFVSVVREPDPDFADLAQEAILAYRLVGVKQYEGAELLVCPVEHLLLLKDRGGLPRAAQRLAVTAKEHVERTRAFLLERVGRALAVERQETLRTTIPEREEFLQRGFAFKEAELAAARVKQTEKARAGNRGAQAELARIKQQQQTLVQRRQQAIAVLHREPELIAPRDVRFIAHALVVPSDDPVDQEKYAVQTEEIAMALAWAHEESSGASVQDVHTPELARLAGLSDHPGFDLLSWSNRTRRTSICPVTWSWHTTAARCFISCLPPTSRKKMCAS
jgi:hypothetical protein